MTGVYSIIALNVAVFAMWFLSDLPQKEFLLEHFTVSWDGLRDGRYWTLLTSVFSHYWFFHFFLNMYAFLGFGSIVERTLGIFRFYRFYLVAGAISSLCHCLVSAFLIGDSSLPAMGASGAVSAVIVVFSLMYPKEKIYIFGLIPLPALTGALLFVGLDIWGLVSQTRGGGLPIGHGAHLGGTFFGILYYFLYLRYRLVAR